MHVLQPKQSKLKADEINLLLEKYNISKAQLPKINHLDPSLASIKELKTGDIIKIERKNYENPFYRVVV
jgi:DNA-directed RNA polymerase subunit H (RpoH/RPB5)